MRWPMTAEKIMKMPKKTATRASSGVASFMEALLWLDFVSTGFATPYCEEGSAAKD